MREWQEDFLRIAAQASCEREVFPRIEVAARALGFDHCAYGWRCPLPLSNPKTVILSNYPDAWRARYAAANYLRTDPTVLHGRRSQKPLVWSDQVFAGSRQLWEEARSFGLCHGWAQSSLDAFGIGGMLTLARQHDILTPAELECNELKMRWLVNVAHMSLSRIIGDKISEKQFLKLTAREIEVLKWTADGKSAQDIADILLVTKNTVDFHVKNAVTKLQTPNKTAAVVRAAMLGLLTSP